MPREPRAKEIGRIAKNHFPAYIPLNWLLTSLDGDEDYGLDYLVQFKNENNDITYNFFVQLKGTEDKKKISDEFITVKLASHTLNYYQNNGLILIVACDVKRQEYYYEYLHTILQELYGNQRYFDDSNKEYAIKIPKSQKLTPLLNIEHFLENYALGNHANQRKFAIMKEYKIVQMPQEDKEDYIEKKTIYKNSFTYQKGRVYLDAYIPNDYDFNISIMLIFKVTDAEKAMITPDEQTIINTLFSGYKSNANSKSRKWFVSALGNQFIIQIGDVRLTVPVEVIVDLSDILDSLFEVYISRIGSFENKLNSTYFPPSKQYENGFKLIKIHRHLWKYIHQFAEKHRFRDGETEWHIFGYDNFSLLVHLKDLPFQWSGNIVIRPELDDSFMSYKSMDDTVVLVWDSLPYETYERKNAENFLLDVEKTHRWLIEVLIPRVIYEFTIQNITYKWHERLLRKKKPLEYDDFLSTFDIKKYVFWEYQSVNTNVFKNKKDYFFYMINELHRLYKSQRDLYVNAVA